ncbi:major capsid protein [Corynebacterium pacaense]|uniref:major capsid protein n=1 Tax=Corynebacterium pacaense TaxID=1816684 RepID=UPI0009BC6237|nr:major capsid protein [Corynebacterium pacaense]
MANPILGNLAGKSSVFGTPADTTLSRDVLSDPGALADILAQYAKDSLPVQIFGEELAPSGNVVYTQAGPEDLTVEGIGDRGELSEYPMVRFSPTDLKEVRTADIGGKFRVSDEAIAAGDTTLLGDGIALLGNQIERLLDQMMIGALEQAVNNGPGHTMGATSGWFGVELDGANPTPAKARPRADLVRARRILRQKGLVASGNTLLLSSDSWDNLATAYDIPALAEEWGLALYQSDHVAEGCGYLIEGVGFGKLVTRQGIQTETWRDPAIRATWAQAFCEPVVIINRPTNIVKLTGLDGDANA